MNQLLKWLHSCHHLNVRKLLINRISLLKKLFDLIIPVFSIQKRIFAGAFQSFFQCFQ